MSVFGISNSVSVKVSNEAGLTQINGIADEHSADQSIPTSREVDREELSRLRVEAAGWREWLLREFRAMNNVEMAVALAASSMPSSKQAAKQYGPDAWQDWAVEGLMKLGMHGVRVKAEASRRAVAQGVKTDDWSEYARIWGSCRRASTAVDIAPPMIRVAATGTGTK